MSRGLLFSLVVVLTLGSLAPSPRDGSSAEAHALPGFGAPARIADAVEFHAYGSFRSRLEVIRRPAARRVRQGSSILGPNLRSGSSGGMPAPEVYVQGLRNTSGVSPSDVNGDVGPTQYVQTVNHAAGTRVGVFDKQGQLLFRPFNMGDLWDAVGGICASQGHGDPIVQFDALAGRWVITQFAFRRDREGTDHPPFYECIAVSSTSDFTSGGTAYTFLIDDRWFPDFPKFGVWNDGYYMSAHLFGPRSYKGQAIIAFDRERMLQGLPAREIQYFFNPSHYGALPADLAGTTAAPPGTPNFLTVVKDDNVSRFRDSVQLYEFHVDWATPDNTVITGPQVLRTGSFNSKLCGGNLMCIPQRGTWMRLDPLAGEPAMGGTLLMYPMTYRNFGDHESLYFTHNVASGRRRASVRWYELRNPSTDPVIAQQATISPADRRSRWIGSLNTDRVGNLSIGYSVSSPRMYPSIMYAGRLASDPPGAMTQAETLLLRGSGSQKGSLRWGDYNSMHVDPVDDCTFWYTNQYLARTAHSAWRTVIAAWRFPSCT